MFQQKGQNTMTVAKFNIIFMIAFVFFGPANAAREIVLVGNNWDGTATIFDAQSYDVIKTINIVPDREDRIKEIKSILNPIHFLVYKYIQIRLAEGNDQLCDDLYASPDGSFIIASRPSYADVVALNVTTGDIIWRIPIAGYRADHAAISGDGTVFLVSASTANVVQAINTTTGLIVGEWKSGDTPHEIIYGPSQDKIYHASIGRNYVPLKSRLFDFIKGQRIVQIIHNTPDYEILNQFSMEEKLTDFLGEPPIDFAVRPMAITQDENYIYMQISFYHGFFEYDITKGKVTRYCDLPVAEEVSGQLQYPWNFYLNSAHHGLALNGDDTKLCVAGTVSGYAAIVDRDTFDYELVWLGTDDVEFFKSAPYWATTSKDGFYCYVSCSRQDRVVVINYDDASIKKSIPVGYHPQRVRKGLLLDV